MMPLRLLYLGREPPGDRGGEGAFVLQQGVEELAPVYVPMQTLDWCFPLSTGFFKTSNKALFHQSIHTR